MDVLARTALGLDGATFAALWAKAHGISDGLRSSAVLAIGGPIAVWPRRRKSLDGAPLNT